MSCFFVTLFGHTTTDYGEKAVDTMNYAIVLAGGTGKRLGADIPKQFTRIAGRPVITYVLEILENAACVDGVCVVTIPSYRQAVWEWCADCGYRKVRWVAEGGDTCQASTYCGVNVLKGVAKKEDVVGVAVNLAAAFVTREGESLNQKAVNLHMLEDVLTWAVVLVGAVVMRFTNLTVLDPLVSIAVAVYIFIHAIGHLRAAVDIFLEKVPDGFAVEEIQHRVAEIEGVSHPHHIHIRSIDGYTHAASLHVVSERTDAIAAVTAVLNEMGIFHVTVQVKREVCPQTACGLVEEQEHRHGGHHHP